MATASPARRALWEWVALATALILLVVLQGPLPSALRGTAAAPDPTGSTGLASPVGYLNIFFYDTSLDLDAAPPDPSVAVVAIDDISLAQVGRWPWPRTVVASLLDRLEAARPAAIALDVLFVEPAANPREDEILTEALRRISAKGIRVVLAVGKEPSGGDTFLPLYPLPGLAIGTTLAHTTFVSGADGLARGLHLREGHLPALGLALVDPGAVQDPAETARMISAGDWDTAQPLLIGGSSRDIEQFSAAAVLRGEIEPSRLEGRRILLGSTAIGTGDQFATPLFTGRLRASGVEMHAAAASALLTGHTKRAVDPRLHALVGSAIVIVVMALLYLTRPLAGFVVTIASLAAVALLTFASFRGGWWVQPGGLLLAIGIAYPLWSWRRLTAASAGLFVQARSLELAGTVFDAPRTAAAPLEPISAQLVRIQDAAAQARRLNRFLMDGIRSLPHPVLISDRRLRVLLTNERLTAAFAQPPAPGSGLIPWLDTVFAGLPQQVAGDPSLIGGERRDLSGRSWLVDVSATGDDNDDVRWLVQLVDVSALRAAEREREEALSFLSHDLRSPQAAILAMIERSRQDGSDGVGLDLSELERQSRRALALTDGFLAYARADSKPVAFEDCDLAAIATEVVDLAWFSARSRQIRIIADGSREAHTLADADLLRRALLNLVENAIRHCRVGGEVRVTVADQDTYWQLTVRDEGPGIPLPERQLIFQPFWQAPGAAAPAGRAGLGLAMVHKTVLRHNGIITVADGAHGPGAVFEIRLPKHEASIIPDSATD